MKDSAELDHSSTADLEGRQQGGAGPRDPWRAHAILMRRAIAFVLAMGGAVLLVQMAIVPELKTSPSSVVLTRIAIPLLVARWCWFDGRLRGKVPVRMGLLGIFFVPHLGFVIYSFWSRGWRGVLPILIAFGVFFVLCALVMILIEPVPGSIFAEP